MAKRRSQSDHDRMVLTIAVNLGVAGHSDIRADLLGQQQPEKITWRNADKGHIPDVTAIDLGRVFHLYEVETDDSINEEHTADQWGLFSAFAAQNGAIFHVAVPQTSVSDANLRALTLGLTNVYVVGL